MTPFPFRKAHFIGLAGVGMSATAILLRDSGVAVTGSDEAIYPPISQVLAREAFACRAPYAAQNIPDDADLIVIGKNARLVPNENEEVAEAFARAARPGGPKILSFAEGLALLSRGHENIVVAGSFGKTTSVAMMAHCLANAGLDPSWMIGAVPLSPARASNAGTGQLFLLEGEVTRFSTERTRDERWWRSAAETAAPDLPVLSSSRGLIASHPYHSRQTTID